jgi:RNA polymerase sigma-70 factor (ECF subfamily)
MVERMYANRASLSDELLMLAFAKDDVLAFEVLYRRHKDRVCRRCRDRDVAEDLMNGIGMKLVRERHRYRAKAPFVSYLLTLAHHRLIDY